MVFPAGEAKHLRILTVAALLVLLAVVDACSIRHKSITYDEPIHLRYGLQVLGGDSARFDDSKMPISALNAFPRRLSESLEPGAAKEFLGGLQAARYVTIGLAMLLAFLVYAWSSRMYGPTAGLFSLFLCALSPNLQAHARWATTDLHAALTVTLALFSFWRLLGRGGWVSAAASGATLGLAQLAKFSAAHLYVIFALILAGRGIAEWQASRPDERRALFVRRATDCLRYGAVLFVAFLLVLNAGYLFNGTGTPLGDYEFRSELFRSAQDGLGLLDAVPLPLPRPYVEGLDWVRAYESSGEGRGVAYLLGQVSREGFAWYYLIAFLFKVPIATQILLVAATVHYAARRREFDFARNEIFLFVPILVYAVYFNFFSGAQMGIRLLLVIFPALFVFCGSLLRSRPAPWGRVAIAVLACWLGASALSYYPHFLSYFNELVPERKKAYRVLADSNLDWGQNEWYVERYLASRPWVHKNPRRPVAGRIVITANLVTGIINPDNPWYLWLRDRLEPEEHVAYSYLVYVVPPEALRELGATEQRP